MEALADRLRTHFGDNDVFLDVESIPVGDLYPQQLRARLAAAEVLVVVIGSGWLKETRHRAVLKAKDWVRFEISETLRASTPIVQIVLDDVPLPTDDQLPEDIRALALRQAFRLRRGKFRSDIAQLIQLLERHVAPQWQAPPTPGPTAPSRWLTVVVLAASLALFLYGPFMAIRYGPATSQRPWLDFASRPVLLLICYLALIAAICQWRDQVDRLEHMAAEASPAVSILLLIIPIELVAVVGYALLVPRSIDTNNGDAWVGLLVLMGLAILMSLGALRVYRQMIAWPPDTHGPGGLRAAIARFRERLDLWGLL